MKLLHARVSYYDRKTGPHTGSTFQVSGSNLHVAASRAVKKFTRDLTRKQMNDVREHGLTVYLLPVPDASDKHSSTEGA